MRSFVISRSAVPLALVLLAACSSSANSNTAQTPLPSGTTLAQANSTAAPMQALSKGPGEKYAAMTGADKDVVFEIWANGSPVGTIQWPNKGIDITKGMRGHANLLVIKWTKTKKSGTGTAWIQSLGGVRQMTAVVTNSSPAKGSYSRTIIAPQMPAGRSSTNP